MPCVTDSVQLVRRIHTKEALEGFGDFSVEGQVIRTVKYADDIVLVAKVATVGRLIEIGRCCGMEKNVEKLRYWESEGSLPQYTLW